MLRDLMSPPDMVDTPPAPCPDPSTRLNGWKEIAAYFGKGVRTAQRWEKDLGLPVHRVRNEIVYAYADELEAWRVTAEKHRSYERNGDRAADSPAQPTDAPVALEVGTALDQPSVDPPATASLAQGLRRHRVMLPGIGLAALVVVAAVAWVGSGSRGGTIRQASVERSGAVRDLQPADWHVSSGTLSVYNSSGSLLWKWPFPVQPVDSVYSKSARQDNLSPVVIRDLDGDGHTEVVLMTIGEPPHELVCLNSDGSVRYQTHPQHSVTFGERVFVGPWNGYHLLTTERAGKATVWAVWIHPSGDFPTLLQRVSPSDGHPLSEYWSDGYVESVRAATLNGRPAFLVGAADNELKRGALAVFDFDKVSGSAWAADRTFVCSEGCPPGGPRLMLAFPRLEFLEWTNGTPGVIRIDVDALDRVTVGVEQAYGVKPLADEPGTPQAEVFYTIEIGDSGAALPVSAAFSERYEALHRRREKAGLLEHALGSEDEARLWPVWFWNGKGWASLPIPHRVR
jgi:hypothetical protein